MQYKFINGKGEHRHELDGQPLFGTTTVINEIYPPPLTWWAAGRALELIGWLNPKYNDEVTLKRAAKDGLERLKGIVSVDEYLDLLDRCYRNHDAIKRDAAKKGTDAHALIEEYIKLCLANSGTPVTGLAEPQDEKKITLTNTDVGKFAEWAIKNVYRFLWSEAHIFSKNLWTGGVSDWGAILKDGSVIIGDNKPSIYPKHFIQCAGYGIQYKENGLFTADGERIKVPRYIIDGYIIYDYKTGKTSCRKEVEELESDFRHTVKMYKRRDIIGTELWVQ